MKEPIISVSGLRGIIGESLSPESAMRFACAFAAGMKAGPIVVSRDGRATGRMLADAIRSGLCAVGRDVIDADVAATPTSGVLVRQLQAAGGIQISASHNPAAYNGIKLFGPDGRVIVAEHGEQVVQQYRRGDTSWVAHDQIGAVANCEDVVAGHLKLVLATVDSGRIRTQRFKLMCFYGNAREGDRVEDFWELYDLERDPRELRNVYTDPTYTDELRALEDELHRLRRELDDSGGVVPGR